MTLKSLTTTQMLELTGAILEPDSPARRALAAASERGALIAQIQRAYDVLLATRPPSHSQLAKLTAELSALDARHDACVRALLMRIDAELVIAANGEAEEQLRTLREALFPSGASIVLRSYVDQAGEARQRDARLTEDMRRTLRSLRTLDGRTGEALYEVLQASARALGQGEAKRHEIGASGELASKVGAARTQWVRAIHSIAAFFAAEGLDDRPVLGAIRAAVQKAERAKAGLPPLGSPIDGGGGAGSADGGGSGGEPGAEFDPTTDL